MGESKTREQATVGNTFIHLFNAEIDLFRSTTVFSNFISQQSTTNIPGMSSECSINMRWNNIKKIMQNYTYDMYIYINVLILYNKARSMHILSVGIFKMNQINNNKKQL